jgi:hypothetical protein
MIQFQEDDYALVDLNGSSGILSRMASSLAECRGEDRNLAVNTAQFFPSAHKRVSLLIQWELKSQTRQGTKKG